MSAFLISPSDPQTFKSIDWHKGRKWGWDDLRYFIARYLQLIWGGNEKARDISYWRTTTSAPNLIFEISQEPDQLATSRKR